MENKRQILLQAVSPTLKYIGGVTLQNPHGLSILSGNIYAVVGRNGCGKTTLGKILENGWNFATNKIVGDKSSLKIRMVEFSDIHSLTGFTGAYYQQRFESMANDDVPTVKDLVGERVPVDMWTELCRQLNLADIMDKRVNYLSSGELRKFLIVNILTSEPDILIIDNPYIGLDSQSRVLFNAMLRSVSQRGTAVILLLCDPADIPPFVNFVVPMSVMGIDKTIAVDANSDGQAIADQCMRLFAKSDSVDLPQIEMPDVPKFNVAFSLSHCDVSYGNTVILHDVCWQVKAGEKWALCGENGSGKSTLLSLVCCDNPQGYCNDIVIFDRKRGTGESIWDVKRNISYISPEMHLYFNGGKRVIDVVASGVSDMRGLYAMPSAVQCEKAMEWMSVFGIDGLAQRRFSTLSSGEQRIALLARTLNKPAPLLIFDEPLHGLDVMNKRLVNDVINRVSSSSRVAMVYVTHYEAEIPATVTHRFVLRRSNNVGDADKRK